MDTIIEEIKRLKAQRNELVQQVKALQKTSTDSKRSWKEINRLLSGIEEVHVSDDDIHVRFFPMYRGRLHSTYSLQMVKEYDGSWRAPFRDVPPSLNALFAKLETNPVKSKSSLYYFIYQVWHQIIMYVHRAEQFKEAQQEFSHSLEIYSSIDSLKVMVEMDVMDSEESSSLSVKINLTYSPERFFPCNISIKHTGGTLEAQEQCSKDLNSLLFMPLKDAIAVAFSPQREQTSASSSTDSVVPLRIKSKMTKTPTVPLKSSDPNSQERAEHKKRRH